MFVKRSVKPSLVENFEDAEKIEVELESVNKYSAEPKVQNFDGKKPFFVDKAQG